MNLTTRKGREARWLEQDEYPSRRLTLMEARLVFDGLDILGRMALALEAETFLKGLSFYVWRKWRRAIDAALDQARADYAEWRDEE